VPAGGRDAPDSPVRHDGSVSTPDSSRSVKISPDERTGWSSERPRRDGAPPRPVDISVRSRVLSPSDRLRYSPGSLLLIVGAAAAETARFAERVVEERGAVLSLGKVRALLTGRVEEDELEARARELLGAAVLKRLQANQTVIVAIDGFDPAERERYLRLAHGARRPRHLILLETRRDQVLDEERRALDELRRALDANELGLEGFQTTLRLGGNALSELKRIVFQRPPRED
jgi:predicted kinase